MAKLSFTFNSEFPGNPSKEVVRWKEVFSEKYIKPNVFGEGYFGRNINQKNIPKYDSG